jgi:hypothetical protein
MVTINHFQASKKNDKSQCSIYSGHKYYINGADISIHHNANYAKKTKLISKQIFNLSLLFKIDNAMFRVISCL